MFSTNVLLALRSLKRNVLYSALVIFGLAIGVTTFISTLQWSSWHFTYDRSYENSDRIYRLTLEESKESFYRHMARVIHGDVIQSIAFSNAFSGIEKIGRLSPFRKAIIKIEEEEFYENYAYSCDQDWLEIFSPDILHGDKNRLLGEPYTAVITERTAKKYFGSDDPIGRTIEITHQFSIDPDLYIVSGVIKDFPDNSHLKIAILTSYENPMEYSGTAWTYLLLRPDSDPTLLADNLKLYIDSNFEKDYVEKMTPVLQPIQDIHLHSHKPREIIPNIRFKSVIILLITGMFVFLLSWFNFMLLSVSQHQLNVKRLVIQWQMGSGRGELFKQFLIDFLLSGFISMILGFIMILLLQRKIANLTGDFIFQDFKLVLLITLTLIILLICSSLLTAWYSTHRLYRYLRVKYLAAKSTTPPDARLKNHFIRWVIVAEFVITFVLVSNLFLIHKQTNYATSMQMGANLPASLQIPNLHRKVIDQFPLFRERMLESPLISNVTGTMEEPTGQTMDAVEFNIDGIDTEGHRLYLFPAEENFIKFYDINTLYGEDMPSNYNPADSTEYFILNETAANMISPVDPESLIGREMSLDFFYPDLIRPGKIIGISEDFYLSGLDYEITPMVIFPKHTWLYCFSVKIDRDHKAAINHLQTVWEDLFPDFPLSYYYTHELINEYYSTELTEIKIRLIFSLLSVFIAGTGLFALSGFFMNRKLKYAAIKKVHGASVSDILIPELLYYFYIAFIASAIAVLPAYFLMERWLRNFYYKLKIPFYIFIVCALILVLFSWISVIFHSMKLARLNPVETMKN